MELFTKWIKSITEIKTGSQVAIDGKAVRAAARKAENGNIPYVVSAFHCDIGLSIGQKKIDDKTNEITGIPELLDLIDVKDTVVTIDAIGTQTAIIEKIVSKKGNFCLQVKRNNSATYDNIKLYFDSLTENELNELPCYSEENNDHGRSEKREYCIESDTKKIKEILGDKWPQVKALGMTKQQRKTPSGSSEEIHFHILSMVPNAEEYAKYARNHWQIENSLHWILDIHFKEDRSTANSDNAIANLSLLRKIAFNLSKLDPDEAKKTTKKKQIDYAMDVSLFAHLMFDILPVAEMN